MDREAYREALGRGPEVARSASGTLAPATQTGSGRRCRAGLTRRHGSPSLTDARGFRREADSHHPVRVRLLGRRADRPPGGRSIRRATRSTSRRRTASARLPCRRAWTPTYVDPPLGKLGDLRGGRPQDQGDRRLESLRQADRHLGVGTRASLLELATMLRDMEAYYGELRRPARRISPSTTRCSWSAAAARSSTWPTTTGSTT